MAHFPRELPDLEQTLGDLMLDLLRAKSEYNELVLAAPLDGLGRFSPEAVRVTQHYTMALLAYGYTPHQIMAIRLIRSNFRKPRSGSVLLSRRNRIGGLMRWR